MTSAVRDQLDAIILDLRIILGHFREKREDELDISLQEMVIMDQISRIKEVLRDIS